MSATGFQNLAQINQHERPRFSSWAGSIRDLMYETMELEKSGKDTPIAPYENAIRRVTYMFDLKAETTYSYNSYYTLLVLLDRMIEQVKIRFGDSEEGQELIKKSMDAKTSLESRMLSQSHAAAEQ